MRRLAGWLHGHAPWFVSDAAWWVYFRTPGKKRYQ